MAESFDDFLSTERLMNQFNLKPFQHRDDPESDEKTLAWLRQNFDNAQQAAHSRFITYRRYHALYKGIHWRHFDSRDTQRDIEYTQRKPRHVVNFIHEFTEARVSQAARLKSSVVAIPSHDEISDINNAKAVKLLISARDEEIDMELIDQALDRIKFIYGCSFAFVMWDSDVGPIHPAWERINDRYKDEKMPSSLAKRLRKVPKRVGDVEIWAIGPDRVFPELGKNDWKKIDHVDLIDWVHIEELKAEYPEKKAFIMENTRDFYEYEFSELTRPQSYVMVRYFFHRKTKFLPQGAYLKYTDDVILEMGPYPYDEDDLPFIYDDDITIYNELWGRSFIGNIEQQQRMYNNLQSGVARDLGIGSAPKWMMPKGSVQISNLNNEFTIVEYTGAIPPQLVSSNPVSRNVFEAQDRLEDKMSKMAQIYDISRGKIPKGITANSALRFLDEQESQRAAPMETKRKRRVLKTKRKQLRRMQQFYKKTDNRMIKTLGENNEYLIESFADADFSKIYDIKLQNSSSLPNTKSGRISTIIDLNIATQADPIFRKEEIVQMLDLGLDEAFTDGATVAVNSAKMLVEQMLKGKQVPEPQTYDRHLVHYAIFDRALQSQTFSMKAPAEVRMAVMDRVKVMEGLMYEKATKNQKFLVQLMELDNYPMFFTMPQPLTFLMQQIQPPPPEEVGADTSKIKSLPQQTQQPGA